LLEGVIDRPLFESRGHWSDTTDFSVSRETASPIARDGQIYVMFNALGTDERGARLVELMFEDGLWMLATSADLDSMD